MAAYRENKGSWEIRWSYDGKNYSKGLSIPPHLKDKAKRLAEEKAQEIDLFLSKLEQGLVDVPSNLTDYKLWLFTCGKQGLKEVSLPSTLKLSELIEWFKFCLTYDNYEPKTKLTTQTHINHFLRLIGNIPCATVCENTIQQYINARAKEKNSRGKRVKGDTIQKELGTLSSIWNAAKVEKKVPETFQTLVSKKGLTFPKQDEALPFQTIEQVESQVSLCTTKSELAELWGSLFLRLPEAEQFLEDIKDRNGDSKNRHNRCRWLDTMIATAIYTGARKSELLRLRIADLDFSKKKIRLTEKKKRKAISYRFVPMHDKLVILLTDYLARNNKTVGLLFSQLSGRPLKAEKVNEVFKTAVRKTRWKNVRGWHLFRHSFISNLAAKGTPESYIEKLAGHLNAETRKRYQHLYPELLDDHFQKAFAS